jgi:hypothetical protein
MSETLGSFLFTKAFEVPTAYLLFILARSGENLGPGGICFFELTQGCGAAHASAISFGFKLIPRGAFERGG